MRGSLLCCLAVLACLIAVRQCTKQFVLVDGTPRCSMAAPRRFRDVGVPRKASDESKEQRNDSSFASSVAAGLASGAVLAAGVLGASMPTAASAVTPPVMKQNKGDRGVPVAAVGAAVVAAAGVAALPAMQAAQGLYQRREYATIELPKEPKQKKDKNVAAKKELRKDTAPTGNSLASTLKFCCDAANACYSIYWIPVTGGKYVAAGEYYIPSKSASLKGSGGNSSLAQKLSKAEVGAASVLGTCAKDGSTVYVADSSKCKDSQRVGTLKGFGVKSFQIEPFDSGLLEFGSDTACAKYEGAPVPLDGLREAFEIYGSTYNLFWQKNKQGSFECASDFVTPARVKALRNRRGDDKTFASESMGLKLPAESMVGRVFSSGKEAVLENAMTDPKFTRAALAKEFGVRCIRVVPCEGGVLEYGIPRDNQLAGNTFSSMLKMRCNMAQMDFAIYWVEDGGQFVVSGTYSPRFAKAEFKKQRNDEDRFEKRCEKLKLSVSNLNRGFVNDASTSNASGRQALAKEFGINTLCQESVTGGVLEFGTRKTLSAKPNIPLLPEKELKNSFDEFGAVYVIMWVLRGDKWLPEANYTTPERVAYVEATRTDGKTYCTECNGLKLGTSSVVGFCNSSRQTDVIYGADNNKQFTRRALAKEFNLQTIRFVPCQDGVVLESGTSERKTIGKKSSFRVDGGKGQTERGRLANLSRLKQEAKSTPTGIFSPYVDFGKDVLGEDYVVEARKEWIQQHTDYIAKGVKAAQPAWAQPLFASFDKNGDGIMDRNEFATYIETMSGGEKPTKDKVDKMMRNYDPDNTGIEFTEFIDASPTFVRKSLIKLASRNGKKWGLMV